jgi:purine-nucleoside/S-methyl-5'-thioadenosine phosphorylase / adenosine deaminase
VRSWSVSTTDEVRVRGTPPLWEIPGWRSRFGVEAGITGRGEGDPFDLGLGDAAPVGLVMERWRAFRGAFPGAPACVLSRQVHGNSVVWHQNVPPGWLLFDGADGHATTAPGTLLLVTVADCVPVYLVAPERGAVALLHAGWRGVASGILERGVSVLAERTGADPGDLVMHAGVAISGGAYEVGREVMAAVGAEAEGDGPWHLDLRQRLVAQAHRLGIGEVTVSSHCTAGEATEFFSHRRSGGRDGRMVAFLGRAVGSRER